MNDLIPFFAWIYNSSSDTKLKFGAALLVLLYLIVYLHQTEKSNWKPLFLTSEFFLIMIQAVNLWRSNYYLNTICSYSCPWFSFSFSTQVRFQLSADDYRKYRAHISGHVVILWNMNRSSLKMRWPQHVSLSYCSWFLFTFAKVISFASSSPLLHCQSHLFASSSPCHHVKANAATRRPLFHHLSWAHALNSPSITLHFLHNRQRLLRSKNDITLTH